MYKFKGKYMPQEVKRLERYVKAHPKAKIGEVRKKTGIAVLNDDLQLIKDRVVYGLDTVRIISDFKSDNMDPFVTFSKKFPKCPQWRYYGLQRLAKTGQSGYKQKGVAKKSSVVTIIGTIEAKNTNAPVVKGLCEQILEVLNNGGALVNNVSVVELADPHALEFRMK